MMIRTMIIMNITCVSMMSDYDVGDHGDDYLNDVIMITMMIMIIMSM